MTKFLLKGTGTPSQGLHLISLTGFFLFALLPIRAQDRQPSIHMEQQEYYGQFGDRETAFYDSLSGFSGVTRFSKITDCQLQRSVFGFHPYWAGSDYLNYQWNLISDLCYFSYEVDPSTGGPVTYHDWLDDPAIDSAKANGARVHLCATIFSGHNSFFTNMASRQNLINNLVSLVQQRNADGVNMDIEAVPSYLGDSITAFMRDLSIQLKAALPAAQISICLPAVDWSGNFHIDSLTNCVDWFFIMGYDYYWNGSSQAGPVSPLYSFTSGYDYSLSRTISAFESSGVKQEKLILGVPYYGRQWKTQSGNIPSQTLANGTALTYSGIRANGGTYNLANFQWQAHSLSSSYIFYQNGNWNQCFIDLDRDLRKKYDIVNYRDLAGIGIWALGYDNNYPDLWQAISDKFSDCYIPLTYDTLYDSGGPAWNYYTDEDYSVTFDHGFNDLRWLTFTGFSLEGGYDSLWLYAGPDTTFPFLGGFSGQASPGAFSSDNGAFTLRFKSDPLQNAQGWMAVYHDGAFGVDENLFNADQSIEVYPNPASLFVNIVISGNRPEKLFVLDIFGRKHYQLDIIKEETARPIQLNLTGWTAGIYTIIITNSEGQITTSQFMILK